MVLLAVCSAFARQDVPPIGNDDPEVAALKLAINKPPDASAKDLIELSKLLSDPVNQLRWLLNCADAVKGTDNEKAKALVAEYDGRLSEFQHAAAKLGAFKVLWEKRKPDADALAGAVEALKKALEPAPVVISPWGVTDGDEAPKAEFKSALEKLKVVLESAAGDGLDKQFGMLSDMPKSQKNPDQWSNTDLARELTRTLVFYQLRVELRGEAEVTADVWSKAHDKLNQANLPGWAAVASVLQSLASNDANAGKIAKETLEKLPSAAEQPASRVVELLKSLAEQLAKPDSAGKSEIGGYATGKFFADRGARLKPLETAVRDAYNAAKNANNSRGSVDTLWQAIQKLKDARAVGGGELPAKWQPLSVDAIDKGTGFERSTPITTGIESNHLVFLELVGLPGSQRGSPDEYFGILISSKFKQESGSPMASVAASGSSDDAVLKALFDQTIKYRDQGPAAGLAVSQIYGVFVGVDRIPSDAVSTAGALRAIWRDADFPGDKPAYFVPSASIFARKFFRLPKESKVWSERALRQSWFEASGDVRGLIVLKQMPNNAALPRKPFDDPFAVRALHGNLNKLSTNADLRAEMRKGDGTILVLLDP